MAMEMVLSMGKQAKPEYGYARVRTPKYVVGFQVTVVARYGLSERRLTHQRYTYVDLSLSELRKGVDHVRTTLQDYDLPTRAWILFFDSSLGGEWVGIHPDTPPPPL